MIHTKKTGWSRLHPHQCNYVEAGPKDPSRLGSTSNTPLKMWTSDVLLDCRCFLWAVNSINAAAGLPQVHIAELVIVAAIGRVAALGSGIGPDATFIRTILITIIS